LKLGSSGQWQLAIINLSAVSHGATTLSAVGVIKARRGSEHRMLGVVTVVSCANGIE